MQVEGGCPAELQRGAMGMLVCRTLSKA